jgi:hypothetical protein
LSAEDPEARKKTPRTGKIISSEIPCLARMKPADAESVAKKEILNFVNVKRRLK